MSIDPNHGAPAAAKESFAVSAIENEIPAYRAISAQSVIALILGILSVLSFASSYFLVFAVFAVVLGFLADKKIQRLPDVLTGRGFAQTGFGLGLVFGLTSVTIGTVQSVIHTSQARVFARQYEKALKTHSFEQLVWYTQTPTFRAQYTPDKLITEMRKSAKAGGGPDIIENKYASLVSLTQTLSQPGVEIHFNRIESVGEDGMDLYAAALYTIHNPRPKPPAESEQYALALLKALKNKSGQFEWLVEEVTYPYQPSTFVAPQKAVDDGHGHGPGGH